MNPNIGKKYGRLLITGSFRKNKTAVMYETLCDCGNKGVSSITVLKKGIVVSCGCFKREYMASKKTTHNMSNHPLYWTWVQMRSRCNNKRNLHYKNYGGRGIKVCERWDDFTLFLVDVGERPSGEYSLDRIDNNGNYEPGNVRWATRKEQLNNTRRNTLNKIVGIGCKKQPIKEWIKEYAIPEATYYSRVFRGEDIVSAITRPVNIKCRKIKTAI